MCSTSVVMPKPKTSISSAEPTKAKAKSNRIAKDLHGFVVRVGEHPAEAQLQGGLLRAAPAGGAGVLCALVRLDGSLGLCLAV